MTVYLSNRDGDGKTNEEGHYRLLSKVLEGQVLLPEDIEVTESEVLGLSVDVQPGDYKLDTASDYSYMGWIDDVETVSITTPDPSNPRITTIVLYVDKLADTAPAPPNNPGIAKLVAINGSAASSPVAPSDSTIQTAVGSGNPFMKLAEVLVGASVTQITNSNITDLRERIRFVDEVIQASDLISFVGPLLYPVGSVYTNATDSTNPSTLLGFGTWSQVSQGRVLVGIDITDDDFGAPLNIGGTKSETLSESQIPSHNHTIDPPSTSTSTNGYHSHSFNRDVAFTDNSSRRTGPSNPQQAYGFGNNLINPDGNHSHTVNIPSFTSGSKGGGGSHNNLQPYMVVYMWRRTA